MGIAFDLVMPETNDLSRNLLLTRWIVADRSAKSPCSWRMFDKKPSLVPQEYFWRQTTPAVQKCWWCRFKGRVRFVYPVSFLKKSVKCSRSFASGKIDWVVDKRPFLQTGHSEVWVFSIKSMIALLACSTGNADWIASSSSSNCLHSKSFSFRPRFARNPKWRMCMNPDGNTCIRNLRKNSTAPRVMMRFTFSFL